MKSASHNKLLIARREIMKHLFFYVICVLHDIDSVNTAPH